MPQRNKERNDIFSALPPLNLEHFIKRNSQKFLFQSSNYDKSSLCTYQVVYPCHRCNSTPLPHCLINSVITIANICYFMTSDSTLGADRTTSCCLDQFCIKQICVQCFSAAKNHNYLQPHIVASIYKLYCLVSNNSK